MPTDEVPNESPLDVVRDQAEDDGLWFIADNITEAYLQQELRRLHTAIEASPYKAVHPESYCHKCGRPNVTSWSTPSPLWNAVMRNETGHEPWGGIICPICFSQLAEALGYTSGHWRFYPETLKVELPKTSPDGRVWNEEEWMWE